MNNTSHASSIREFCSNPVLRKRQGGTVLVFALLVMLALTVIGLSGIGNSVVEEKLAGGMRDRNNAFQAAESALVRGQQFFKPMIGVAAFNGTGGQYGEADPDPDIWDPNTWTASNSISYLDPIVNTALPATIANVAAQPRYIIKYLGDVPEDSGRRSINIGGYGEGGAATKISNFRITARGVGSELGSVVILESYYGKRF